MRRAFTLIEILVVVAIMAIMATSTVLGVRAGQDAARVKGATRDIMASIRHARSMALVMMQPAIITDSTTHVDDEVCAQIKVDGANIKLTVADLSPAADYQVTTGTDVANVSEPVASTVDGSTFTVSKDAGKFFKVIGTRKVAQ